MILLIKDLFYKIIYFKINIIIKNQKYFKNKPFILILFNLFNTIYNRKIYSLLNIIEFGTPK